jgi:site-specific DNA-methyltransferase (adenine-specific)/adenine-specific DNA-methyltransferase
MSIETSSDKRRTDYPTQKPEALLERIVLALSSPCDLVFDCFMGSGTTQAVAMKLGRRFIGADINLGAIQTTTKRLLTVSSELATQSQELLPEEDKPSVFYTGFDVYNVNNYDLFRNPVQAKELLIQALEINPLPPGSLFDGEKDGRMVKIMPINRIATRQDLNELITGFDYRSFEKRQAEHPNQAVEKVTLVCMGHEPDLAAHLQHQISPFKLDIEVVDILRDKQDLQFRRDSQTKIVIRDGYLIIEQFYPMNLLAKLSLQQEHVENWRELVDSVMVDWNYDGAVLQPAITDVPEEHKFVAGRYCMPEDAGTIRVKITDLLSESLEEEITHG